MPPSAFTEQAAAAAEQYLHTKRDECRAAAIWPSACRVMDRLLSGAGRAEMAPVYAELARKLHRLDTRKEVLWQLVLLAALWPPERLQAERYQLERAAELSAEIAAKARELATLLRKRADICPAAALPADYHPARLIDRAAVDNADYRLAGLFRGHVQKRLALLAGQFDMRYWPSTADVMDALADEQARVELVPRDDISLAVTLTRSYAAENGAADFIRALVADIPRMRDDLDCTPLKLPGDFDLSHESLARFANAALALDPPLSGDAVRKLRKRFEQNLSEFDSV